MPSSYDSHYTSMKTRVPLRNCLFGDMYNPVKSRRIDNGNITMAVGVMLRYWLYLFTTENADVGYGPKPVFQLC